MIESYWEKGLRTEKEKTGRKSQKRIQVKVDDGRKQGRVGQTLSRKGSRKSKVGLQQSGQRSKKSSRPGKLFQQNHPNNSQTKALSFSNQNNTPLPLPPSQPPPDPYTQQLQLTNLHLTQTITRLQAHLRHKDSLLAQCEQQISYLKRKFGELFDEKGGRDGGKGMDCLGWEKGMGMGKRIEYEDDSGNEGNEDEDEDEERNRERDSESVGFGGKMCKKEQQQSIDSISIEGRCGVEQITLINQINQKNPYTRNPLHPLQPITNTHSQHNNQTPTPPHLTHPTKQPAPSFTPHHPSTQQNTPPLVSSHQTIHPLISANKPTTITTSSAITSTHRLAVFFHRRNVGGQ